MNGLPVFLLNLLAICTARPQYLGIDPQGGFPGLTADQTKAISGQAAIPGAPGSTPGQFNAATVPGAQQQQYGSPGASSQQQYGVTVASPQQQYGVHGASLQQPTYGALAQQYGHPGSSSQQNWVPGATGSNLGQPAFQGQSGVEAPGSVPAPDEPKAPDAPGSVPALVLAVEPEAPKVPEAPASVP